MDSSNVASFAIAILSSIIAVIAAAFARMAQSVSKAREHEIENIRRQQIDNIKSIAEHREDAEIHCRGLDTQMSRLENKVDARMDRLEGKMDALILSMAGRAGSRQREDQ